MHTRLAPGEGNQKRSPDIETPRLHDGGRGTAMAFTNNTVRSETQSALRLEARRSQLYFGVRPRFSKSLLHSAGFIILPLRSQCGGQTVKRPSILGEAFQIVAVYLLRFRVPTGLEECRTERLPHWVVPL